MQTEKAKSSHFDRTRADKKQIFPTKGTSRKLHSPWRGIYTIVEKTNDVIYKIKKKGGRVKTAHINCIKYYDPENSESDEDTHISNEEDEDTQTDTQSTGPTAETILYPHRLTDIPPRRTSVRMKLPTLPGSPPRTYHPYGEAITLHPTTQFSRRNLGHYLSNIPHNPLLNE